MFRRTHPHVDVKLIRAVAPQLLARLERGELHTVVAIGEPADTRRPMIEHSALPKKCVRKGSGGTAPA
jgi:DNA-binding transcriptional LysR family regulator